MLILFVHRTNIFKTETKMRAFTFMPFHLYRLWGCPLPRSVWILARPDWLALRPILHTIQSVQVAISLVLSSHGAKPTIPI